MICHSFSVDHLGNNGKTLFFLSAVLAQFPSLPEITEITHSSCHQGFATLVPDLGKPFPHFSDGEVLSLQGPAEPPYLPSPCSPCGS